MKNQIAKVIECWWGNETTQRCQVVDIVQRQATPFPLSEYLKEECRSSSAGDSRDWLPYKQPKVIPHKATSLINK